MANPIYRMAFSAIAGAAMASLGVAMMMKPAPVEHHAACFGVGTGVCFSGSTEWVAAAAAATKSLDVKMAMTGDAI